LENNAEIRLLGSTVDMTVERNVIRNSDRGILVNSLGEDTADWVRLIYRSRVMSTLEILEALDEYRAVKEALLEKGPAAGEKGVLFPSDSLYAPRGLVIRNNEFENVLFPYIGDALGHAVLLPEVSKVLVNVGDKGVDSGGQ